MNRRIIRLFAVPALALVIAAVIYLSAGRATETLTRFTVRASDIFDTEISLTGFAKSEEVFAAAAQETLDRLAYYNRLFDAYNGYGDLHNLWYLNAHAAEAPVEVPQDLYDLISWCRQRWTDGPKAVNIAMGAVLSIWHDYRAAGISDPENAALPPMETLRAAAEHTDFSNVVLDKEKHTVFYSDPELKIDIGAVAKGYAADRIRDYLKDVMPSFLLNLGGNVYAGDKPMDGRNAWAVAVQDPLADLNTLANGGSDQLDILDVASLSTVTSGDYWRYYFVDGKRYHHIIDPETLMPSEQALSVTIVCESSLWADYLSTTLFILPYEEGRALIDSLPDTEAMWVLPDGSLQYSPGMAAYARSLKQ